MKIFNLSKITTILILLSLIPGLVRVGFSQETEIKIMEEKDMDQYVGVYGPHIITLKEGNLHYQREDRPKMQMIPMKEGMFMFKEINYFRLKFIKEGNKIVAIEGTTIMETPTGMINPDKLILTWFDKRINKHYITMKNSNHYSKQLLLLALMFVLIFQSCTKDE